jgi:hypothetical protein
VGRRILILVAVVLVGILVAADRVGASVGAHVLAKKVQDFEHLPNRPSASIGGIPFLTQAFNGKYSDVSIVARGVPVSGVNVTTLNADLRGVHIPLSLVVHNNVSEVPVDKVTGSAFVTFSDANSYLAQHRIGGQLIELGKGPEGGATVFDTTRVHGQVVRLHGVGAVSVSDNVISVDVAGFSGPADKTLTAILDHLSITVPLRGLPFRMQLQTIEVTPQGLRGAGVASNIVLGRHIPR